MSPSTSRTGPLALAQASQILTRRGLADQIALVGVDLVDTFTTTGAPGLTLTCASITQWTPARTFDLITCVHGLHYIGDKLAVLQRAVTWLTPDGLFIADLDPASIRYPDGRPAGRRLTSDLRTAGFTYHPRRHRITHTGNRPPALPWTYLGADDHAGPNYTGQPAVHSHYRPDP